MLRRIALFCILTIAVSINLFSQGGPSDELLSLAMKDKLSVNDSMRAEKLLSDPEVDVNTADADKTTALIWAAANGHKGLVKKLIDNGADVNAYNEDCETALILAAREGHSDIVKLIIDSGKADLDIRDVRSGNTALMEAAYEKDKDSVKLLIDAGATIELKNLHYNYDAIDVAMAKSMVDLAEYMKKMAGIEDEPLESDKVTEVVETEVVEEDDSQLSAPPSETLKYNIALVEAARIGNEKAVSLLLDKGAKVDYKSAGGDTALCAAVKRGHANVVQLLVDYKADITISCSEGKLPYYIAKKLGYQEVVGILDTVRRKHGLGIYQAIDDNDKQEVNELLRKGADIETSGMNGDTPLIYVAYKENADMVRFILSKGADVNAKNDSGTTALNHAIFKANEEIVRLLIENGADVNSVDYSKRTPLDWAQMWDEDGENGEIIRVLKKNGAKTYRQLHEEEQAEKDKKKDDAKGDDGIGDVEPQPSADTNERTAKLDVLNTNENLPTDDPLKIVKITISGKEVEGSNVSYADANREKVKSLSLIENQTFNVGGKNIKFKSDNVSYYDFSIELYDNGEIEKAVLADKTLVSLGTNELAFKSGSDIQFYKTGKVKKAVLAEDTKLGDFTFKTSHSLNSGRDLDCDIFFYESGAIREGVIKGGAYKINGRNLLLGSPKTVTMPTTEFYEDGAIKAAYVMEKAAFKVGDNVFVIAAVDGDGNHVKTRFYENQQIKEFYLSEDLIYKYDGKSTIVKRGQLVRIDKKGKIENLAELQLQ